MTHPASGSGFRACIGASARTGKNSFTFPPGLMGRDSHGGDRDEWRLKDDCADRQDPNLVFCLTVHFIPTPKQRDRSRRPMKRPQLGGS